MGRTTSYRFIVRSQIATSVKTGHDKAVIRTKKEIKGEHLVRPVTKSKEASLPVGVDPLFLADALDKIVDMTFDGRQAAHRVLELRHEKTSVRRSLNRIMGFILMPLRIVRFGPHMCTMHVLPISKSPT